MDVTRQRVTVYAAAAPCWARKKAPAPEAAELLRRSREPAAASYRGVMVVEVFKEGRASAKRVAVRFQKPGLYRREVLGAGGAPVLVVVCDGKTEWVHDPGQRRVWKGEAPQAKVAS